MPRSHASQPLSDTARTVALNLPRLRRMAQALTGSQDGADRFTAATLDRLLEDGTGLTAHPEPRVALFVAFHQVWSRHRAMRDSTGTPIAAADPDPREALLLQAVAGFAPGEVARIMRTDPTDVAVLIRRARSALRGA